MAKKKGDAGPKGGAPAAVAASAPVDKVVKPKTEKPVRKKRGRGGVKKEDANRDAIERQERIAEALDYRRQGFQYRRIADAMGIAASTAYALVQEGLEAIILEPATAVKKIALDQCEEIMQRLMPLLEDGAPGDVIDGILKVQERMLRLHGITGGIRVNLPGGGSVEDGEDGDSETVIIQRIKAAAPVLKPDGPVPATAVKKIALDQCEEIMQRLMPLLEDGAPGDVIDGILKVQERMLRLHGITGGIRVNLPGGGSVEDGDDGDSETVIIQRIKAAAPVLKPDGPVPANPVL